MVKCNREKRGGCRFCNGKLTAFENCTVCNHCKAVARVNGLDNSTLFSNVEATIESIQHYLESNSAFLHEIEQRIINHQELTRKEAEIRDYCLEFQDCQLWFNAFMKVSMDTGELLFRQKLYQLLILSSTFSEVFDCSCVKLFV